MSSTRRIADAGHRGPSAGDAAGATGAAMTVVGLIVVGGLAGAPALRFAGAAWRLLFGWFSYPVALLVALGGALLWRSRNGDLAGLPWSRAVGVEVSLAAALALLAAAGGPLGAAGRDPAPSGGLVGWSLWQVATGWAGPVLSAALWLLVGGAGTYLALGPGLAPDPGPARGGGDSTLRRRPGRNDQRQRARPQGATRGYRRRSPGGAGPAGRLPEDRGRG